MKTPVSIANLPADPAIKRILFIKWSAMGDVALATAIFEDIYRAFPNAEIDLNTTPAFAGLFEYDPRFKQIIVVDIRRKHKRLQVIREWLSRVKQGRYDFILDMQTRKRSRLLLFLLKVIGVKTPYLYGNEARWLYNIYPREKTKYVFDLYHSALKSVGIPVNSFHPVIYFGETHTQRVADIMHQYQLAAQEFAIFSPGCAPAHYLKRWGIQNYSDLANILHERGVKKIVLIGAKDDAEICQAIAQADEKIIVNLCMQTRMLDLIPLSKQSLCVIGNDTGTLHLAAAADVPMVVIFGPTNPARHKPAGEKVRTIQASHEQLDCLNCYRKYCDHHSCMKFVTPKQVADLAESLYKNSEKI